MVGEGRRLMKRSESNVEHGWDGWGVGGGGGGQDWI